MQAYLKAVELLIELASLQTAFLTLDEAIKTTNRRVNALDNVVVPKLENTISYIKASLSASTGLLCGQFANTWTKDSHMSAGRPVCASLQVSMAMPRSTRNCGPMLFPFIYALYLMPVVCDGDGVSAILKPFVVSCGCVTLC